MTEPMMRRRARRRAVVTLVLGALLAALVLLLPATSTPPAHRHVAATQTVPRAVPQVIPQVSAAAASSKPNIVMVMADDMRTDDLRFMPAVRRLLVDQGLTFRNSFSPYPLCCPARASFLTGRYAHNHHVYSHESPYGFKAFDDRRTLATALRASGYNTGFVGKYLNGYGAEPSLVTAGPSFHYVPSGWTDWYGAVDRPADSGYPSGGTYNYTHTIFNVNGSIDDTHAGQYQTNVLGGFARGLVEKYHGSRRPFFLYLSAVAPHFGGPREQGDPTHVLRADGSYVRIATPARPSWVRGHFDKQVRRASGLPANGGPSEADISDKPRPMRWHPEPGQPARAGLLSLTRQRAEALYVLDGEVEQLVATLKRTGEYRNTVLMFTSDNGYFLGEHRMLQGKIKPHEPSLRVPFVVAGPGIPHGQRFDPVTTPGVTATIAQLAGARSRMPYPADALSVVPSIRHDRGWKVPVVTEGLEKNKVFPRSVIRKSPGFRDPRSTIGIRTARWKYVLYSDGDGELYDLDHDPNELHNLVYDARYAGVRARLNRIWTRYKDCAGKSCRAPLPRSFQRTPSQEKAGTDRQSRGVQKRYGYWR